MRTSVRRELRAKAESAKEARAVERRGRHIAQGTASKHERRAATASEKKP